MQAIIWEKFLVILILDRAIVRILYKMLQILVHNILPSKNGQNCGEALNKKKIPKRPIRYKKAFTTMIHLYNSHQID